MKSESYTSLMRSTKLSKNIIKSIYKLTNNAGYLFEKLILNSLNDKDKIDNPPIFIVGPPRSGTTLLYQLMVKRFDLLYFSNLSSLFYKFPTIGFLLQETISKFISSSIDYTSTYGFTDGLLGPSECGDLWYRWFPKDEEHEYVPKGVLPQEYYEELRKSIIAVSKIFNKSILFKNVYLSIRLFPLLESIPEACVIVCVRNPLYNAQSILRARLNLYHDANRWFSAPPRFTRDIKRKPYWEQVVEQVYYILKDIYRAVEYFGNDKFFFVRYEDICSNTHQTLDEIKRFLEKRGVKIKLRGDVPKSFKVDNVKKLPDDVFDLLKIKVSELWGSDYKYEEDRQLKRMRQICKE